MVYRARSRTARATQGNPISKKKKIRRRRRKRGREGGKKERKKKERKKGKVNYYNYSTDMER